MVTSDHTMRNYSNGKRREMNQQKPDEKYLVRPAKEADLAAIADFEVEIAKASFGDEAITDAAFHRRRVAGSLGKPGEITLVAVASEAAGGSGPSGPGPSGFGVSPDDRAPDDRAPDDRAPDGTVSPRANTGPPVGWAWMSARTNSLTGARYGNFRSLAAADGADRGAVGELLMAAILRAAEEAGFTHLTGKVHAGNLGMRSLYRAFGFTATHLTMERRTTS